MTTIAPIPRVPRTPEAVTFEEAVPRAHVRPAQKWRVTAVCWWSLGMCTGVAAGFVLALLTT